MIAIVDEPGYLPAYGGTTAGPIIQEVMKNSLEYLGVPKNYTEEDLEKMGKIAEIEIPNVRGLAIEDAVKIIEERGLRYALDADISVQPGARVINMFPLPGSTLLKEGDIITLYFDEADSVPTINLFD
jgi:stage V sporulation protein D (sporulation-specific penicillin-binding protein)